MRFAVAVSFMQCDVSVGCGHTLMVRGGGLGAFGQCLLEILCRPGKG